MMTCAQWDKWRRLPQKLLHYRSQLTQRQGFLDDGANSQAGSPCRVGLSDVAGENGDTAGRRDFENFPREIELARPGHREVGEDELVASRVALEFRQGLDRFRE